jgi:hypothetical protein
LESQDGRNPGQIVIPCKFFLPDSAWDWYPFEFDGEDVFFGLVKGSENELGYFSLKILTLIRSSMGLRVERDIYYRQHTLEEALKNRF